MNFRRAQRWLACLIFPGAVCLGQANPDAPTPPVPTPLAPRSSVTTAVRVTNGPARTILATNRTARVPATATGFTIPATQPGPEGIFIFDATSKQVELAEGETKAAFVFAITNISSKEVVVQHIQTSCGCTAGKLPSSPWTLQPGEGGHIDVSMDLTGKFGTVTKTATVVSSAGSYPLSVSARLPQVAAGAMGNRGRNLQIASADRQAVFRNDCASCHVQPTIGKAGRELYDTACGICHEAEHRATMVPDLRTRLNHTDRNYWTKWIGEGRVGSLMPAFAATHGGILSEQQIASLVDYLEDDYKKNPPPSKTVPHPTATPAAVGVSPTSAKLADR